MCLQDVMFRPHRARFSTTFLESCSRGESLDTVAGGKQRHAACKIPLFQQSLCLVPVEFHGDH